MSSAIDGPAVATALTAAGFTHMVWIPDTHFGRWEQAIMAAGLGPVRPCREGEAVGLAAGLILGGANPLVVIQCTGFFEAGDAVRNVAFDLGLPLKLIVGVRGQKASESTGTADNCPTFAEPVVAAWRLPVRRFDPFTADAGELADAVQWLRAGDGPGVLLWAE